MISKIQYKHVVKQIEYLQEIVNQYHKEQREKFEGRMKTNPIFTDDELGYSAKARCSCGHGLAYPKDCGNNHYWGCSAILKGIADKKIEHTDQLPFSTYSIKGESEYRGTTRLVPVKPSDSMPSDEGDIGI